MLINKNHITFFLVLWFEKNRFQKKVADKSITLLPTIFNLQKYYHPISFICAWAMPQAKKVLIKVHSLGWRRRLYFASLSLLISLWGKPSKVSLAQSHHLPNWKKETWSYRIWPRERARRLCRQVWGRGRRLGRCWPAGWRRRPAPWRPSFAYLSPSARPGYRPHPPPYMYVRE